MHTTLLQTSLLTPTMQNGMSKVEVISEVNSAQNAETLLYFFDSTMQSLFEQRQYNTHLHTHSHTHLHTHYTLACACSGTGAKVQLGSTENTHTHTHTHTYTHTHT